MKTVYLKILHETGISVNSSVGDVGIEDRCISFINIAPLGDSVAAEIYIWNHEYPINIILILLSGGRVRNY